MVLAGDLDVVLLNGFQPQAGESFQLFDGELAGTFSQLTLPALSNGLQWNTSNLDTTGTINVTPEPSGLVLLGAGAIGLAGYGIRRRRKNRLLSLAATPTINGGMIHHFKMILPPFFLSLFNQLAGQDRHDARHDQEQQVN